MSKNTVNRVSAPDTTESSKRRNAEIEAKRREEERPKLERRNPRAVPVMTREQLNRALALDRGHEVTPMEALIDDNRNVGNEKTAKVLEALQLVESAAGGKLALSKPKIAPAQSVFARAGRRVKLIGHTDDGGKTITPYKPDIGHVPGYDRPKKIYHGSVNSSDFGQVDVYPSENSAFVFGKGASFSRDKGIARMYASPDRNPGREKSNGAEGVREGYVRKGANIADMDSSRISGRDFVSSLTPEEVAELKGIIGDRRWTYIMENLDSQFAADLGKNSGRQGAAGVISEITSGVFGNIGEIEAQRRTHRAGAEFVTRVFKRRGYDGVSYRHGGSHEDEVLLFDPVRDFIETGVEERPHTARRASDKVFLTPGSTKELSIQEIKNLKALREKELAELEAQPPSDLRDSRINRYTSWIEAYNDALKEYDERHPDTGFQKGILPVGADAVRQDSKGGNATQSVRADVVGGDAEGTPVGPAPSGGKVTHGSARIVINPSTFENDKDAMCVAWNEAFRIAMEETGFEPVSEPTERQREFFSDTEYSRDELMLRRTILARICTFDTSVEDPTDEQLQETVEFLESVLEAGFPQNEWEQSCVQKILDVLRSVPAGAPEGTPPEEPQEPSGDAGRAVELGGETEKEEKRDLEAGGAVESDPKYDAQGPAAGPQKDEEVPRQVEDEEKTDLKAGKAVEEDPKYDAQGPAAGPQKDEEVPLKVDEQENRDLTAGGAALADPKYDAEGPAVPKKDERVFP